MIDPLAFHRAILTWYASHGRRDLPWRRTDDPYHIYISEIMLQQTQVKTVLERFYFPFLERFPSLKLLADSASEEVMHAWQGLGYYTRARNLHQAAIRSDGILPDTLDGLLALPGIGTNTAHAILAFGFHQPYPVLEANVKRLLCRLHRFTNREEKLLWEKAWLLLDREYPFDYNQAMMDIGNLICLPKAPRCESCPLESFCQGKENPESYPAKKPTKKTPSKKQNIFVIQSQGKILLLKRDEKLLGGLYGFPESETSEINLEDQTWITSTMHNRGEIKHTYSHFTRVATIWEGEISEIPDSLADSFYPLDEIEQLPTSSFEKKVFALLIT